LIINQAQQLPTVLALENLISTYRIRKQQQKTNQMQLGKLLVCTIRSTKKWIASHSWWQRRRLKKISRVLYPTRGLPWLLSNR